jgi:hypothetical protein
MTVKLCYIYLTMNRREGQGNFTQLTFLNQIEPSVENLCSFSLDVTFMDCRDYVTPVWYIVIVVNKVQDP